jgi:aminoglycoside phosphotransferase family enzyme
MLMGSATTTMSVGRSAKVGKRQVIESILERESAMRDLLLDLQQEDSLVDAALQALGKRVAAFQLNYATSKMATNQGPCASRMCVCAGGDRCS